MAGHSKWANIKHRKGAQDAKRSKIFQKFSKEILVAIKEGGNDPEQNARLRLSIEKAKSGNMPNDNIKRLLEKSDKDQSNFQEITYEGYGPNGIAVLVYALTDNVNRTSPQLKSLFSKSGGNLGGPGSVSYLFNQKGILVIDGELLSADQAMEYALEAGAEDVREEEGVIIIETTPSDMISVKQYFEDKKITEFITSEVSMVAESAVELDGPTQSKLQNLIDALEDNDDVQGVYTNAK